MNRSDSGIQISFIIPVLNGGEFIGSCIEHIRREADAADEIIVVDNGSTDHTLEIVRNSGVTTIAVLPGVTIAALRNHGAILACRDVLAFIDADCIVTPGWRTSVERVLAGPEVSATGSYYDTPEVSTWVERAWWSFRPRYEHRSSFLISGNFVVRKSAFEAVGGFDATLVTDEDTDISRRLLSAGSVLVEAPTVRVIHLGNAKTLSEFFRKEKWHATSIVDAIRHHRIDLPMLLTFVFILTCAFGLVAPVVVGGLHAAVAFPLATMVAPVGTAAYKVARHGNYKYFVHLLPLYLIVYIVRTLVLLEAVLARKR